MTSTASTVSSPGFTPRGQHLIDGAWLAGSGTFLSEPTEGAAQVFATGGRAEVDRAAAAADANVLLPLVVKLLQRWWAPTFP